MAHYTHDAIVGDKVHLYTKVPEEPSEVNSSKHLLRKHNRLHTISFALHVVWLLVIVVLLVLLLKTPVIPQTTTAVQQVVESTRAEQTSTTERHSTPDRNRQFENSLQDVQSKFEEQVKGLNSTLIQVSDRQQALNELLHNATKHLEDQQQSLNSSLQEVQRHLQTYKLTTNTTLRRFNDQITVLQQTLNRTYQNLKQQLEIHELAANDSFADMSTQQQNSTNVLRSEFKDQLETNKRNITSTLWNEFAAHHETAHAARRLPVYNQEKTITSYLYQDGLPALSEITACFWFNGEAGTSWASGAIISIAVPGEDNELMIGTEPEIWIRNSMKDMTTFVSNMDAFWVGWNRHCFTWKGGYKAKWYTDRITNGELELMGSVNVSSDTVRSGGHMTLLQEQDSHGSGLDLSQTLPGQLADFNMWNYEMTADQINTLTCGGVGDVASWDTLQQQGTGQITYEEFPSCETAKLPVYNQERTTSNYLYQDGLPALSGMTVCFWFDGETTGSWKSGSPISISVAGEDNEWMILLSGSGKPEIYIRGLSKYMTIHTSNMDPLWVGWNRHCFTWKAGYTVKWYTDRITNGELELMGSVNVSYATVRSGGHLILLQEQDTHGGGLMLSQTFPGKLADFNMWNYEMTADQINTLTCGGVGNVASWDTLQQQGTGHTTYEEFPQCEATKLPVYNQEYTTTNYLYQDGLPALSEITACFWLNVEAGGSWKGSTPIDIAVSGENDEWTVMILGSGKPRIFIKGSVKYMTTNTSDIDTPWVGWNRHCFTWKAGYKAKWYTDIITNGRLELMGSVNVSSDTVRSGGHMTLLQDQNSDGDLYNSFTVPGKLADFNMWNYEMTADQINTLTCGGVGNVASWDTLQQQGTGQITYEEFPSCEGY